MVFLTMGVGGLLLRGEDVEAEEQGRERVAQLVRQDRDELIFVAIRFA